MRSVLTPVTIVLGVSLLACISPSDDDEDAVPEVQTDPCTDEHDSAFIEGENGAHISYQAPDGDIVAADTMCNETFWYSGGGAQSGTTFHFTPWLVIPRTTEEFNLDWVVYDLAGNEVARQGIEVFDWYWEYQLFEREWQGVSTDILIGPELRGKNLNLVATLENIETQEVISAEARIHLSSRAP